MARMHGVDPAVARRHHCPLVINDERLDCARCPYRRVILVEVQTPAGGRAAGAGLFALGAVRTPVVAVDLNARTGEIVQVTMVGRSTAWKGVPTPGI